MQPLPAAALGGVQGHVRTVQATCASGIAAAAAGSCTSLRNSAAPCAAARRAAHLLQVVSACVSAVGRGRRVLWVATDGAQHSGERARLVDLCQDLYLQQRLVCPVPLAANSACLRVAPCSWPRTS